MIYISAQPDEVYFLWQLELQLFNFRSMGIENDSIHILVGFQPHKGIHPAFEKFVEQNKDVKMFFYPDMRKNRKYMSSIRPHLLAQHYQKYPEMEKEVIFYHDSDILFARKPDWSSLYQDDVWYASDTRFYLNSLYIKRYVDEIGFERMCSILSIPSSSVIAEDENAGGTQYILKRCNANFWKKVEDDCERLYSYLHNEQRYGSHIQNGLQVWCTDMWVIWWNAILSNRKFKIHPLLNFCWADSSIHELEQKTILHYTGNEKKHVFEKTKYKTHAPFYSDLSDIHADNCSYFVVQNIHEYRKVLDGKRKRLCDVLFLIIVNGESTGKDKTDILRKYYLKYWNVDIHICRLEEVDDMLQKSADKRVFILPTNKIIPIGGIETLLHNIKKMPLMKTHYQIRVRQMDSLGVRIFTELLEDDYLKENAGKTIVISGTEELKVYNGITIDKEIIIDTYGL